MTEDYERAFQERKQKRIAESREKNKHHDFTYERNVFELAGMGMFYHAGGIVCGILEDFEQNFTECYLDEFLCRTDKEIEGIKAERDCAYGDERKEFDKEYKEAVADQKKAIEFVKNYRFELQDHLDEYLDWRWSEPVEDDGYDRENISLLTLLLGRIRNWCSSEEAYEETYEGELVNDYLSDQAFERDYYINWIKTRNKGGW